MVAPLLPILGGLGIGLLRSNAANNREDRINQEAKQQARQQNAQELFATIAKQHQDLINQLGGMNPEQFDATVNAIAPILNKGAQTMARLGGMTGRPEVTPSTVTQRQQAMIALQRGKSQTAFAEAQQLGGEGAPTLEKLFALQKQLPPDDPRQATIADAIAKNSTRAPKNPVGVIRTNPETGETRDMFVPPDEINPETDKPFRPGMRIEFDPDTNKFIVTTGDVGSGLTAAQQQAQNQEIQLFSGAADQADALADSEAVGGLAQLGRDIENIAEFTGDLVSAGVSEEISGFFDNVVSLADELMAQDNTIDAETRADLDLDNLATVPIIERSLAYLMARDRQPSGKLLKETIKDAKRDSNITGLGVSEKLARDRLKNISRMFRARVERLGGPEEQPAESTPLTPGGTFLFDPTTGTFSEKPLETEAGPEVVPEAPVRNLRNEVVPEAPIPAPTPLTPAGPLTPEDQSALPQTTPSLAQTGAATGQSSQDLQTQLQADLTELKALKETTGGGQGNPEFTAALDAITEKYRDVIDFRDLLALLL